MQKRNAQQRKVEKLAPVIVGHCCGCRAPADQVLYRVLTVEYRYRCRRCYFLELGYLP
jgi:hypothetical protein